MLTRGSDIEIIYFSISPKSFGQSFQGIWVSQRPPTYLWSWSCYSFDSSKYSSKHQALQISIFPKERNWTYGCGNDRGWYDYLTKFDKWRKGLMEEWWFSLATHPKVVEDPSSNNIARTLQRRKNHIGTWSSYRNKKSIATKSIDFRISHQVKELTHWIFHMEGW